MIASSIVAGADVVNASDALSVLFGFGVTVTALTVSGTAAVVDAAAPVAAVELLSSEEHAADRDGEDADKGRHPSSHRAHIRRSDVCNPSGSRRTPSLA